ncbi:Crp/Fnr family transcriptional regulator [Gudongella oleilytica]|jgi:CRP-like cAMP-binding protein|uniref:Crp/Fnr family transcriptional regulator n=1 Tax=Gudongella oleilytica TaxID=1582259 RepID=UPI002A365A31|nr:Crp/Fnr family transcriptional regulator [Gudongella oleilytica]MDY0257655.1 Crp/Fnr family transcriptional regulator [Gudongella oleilytica]
MKISKYLDSISSTALFKTIPGEDIMEILSRIPWSLSHYKKGQFLHHQGEVCTTLDIILSGIINMQSLDAEGNTLSIQQLHQGDMIGAGLLFANNNQYPMMSIAASDTVVFILSKESIMLLSEKNSDFTLALLQEVSNRASSMTEQLHSIAYKSIRHRLLEILNSESKIQNSRTIILPTSQKNIAEILGVQRQSLSRELNKMKKEGLLEYKNKTIILKY